MCCVSFSLPLGVEGVATVPCLGLGVLRSDFLAVCVGCVFPCFWLVVLVVASFCFVYFGFLPFRPMFNITKRH